MRTVDILTFAAPLETAWSLAHGVEEWPVLLAHYAHVYRLEGQRGGDGLVEMAAWRPFGAGLCWPTWWCSRMWVDHARHEVRYRHMAGITTGMDVIWTLRSVAASHTEVSIVHTWSGPRWPLIGSLAARWVIGPVFIHGIASRTLAGLAQRAAAT